MTKQLVDIPLMTLMRAVVRAQPLYKSQQEKFRINVVGNLDEPNFVDSSQEIITFLNSYKIVITNNLKAYNRYYSASNSIVLQNIYVFLLMYPMYIYISNYSAFPSNLKQTYITNVADPTYRYMLRLYNTIESSFKAIIGRRVAAPIFDKTNNNISIQNMIRVCLTEFIMIHIYDGIVHFNVDLTPEVVSEILVHLTAAEDTSYFNNLIRSLNMEFADTESDKGFKVNSAQLISDTIKSVKSAMINIQSTNNSTSNVANTNLGSRTIEKQYNIDKMSRIIGIYAVEEGIKQLLSDVTMTISVIKWPKTSLLGRDEIDINNESIISANEMQRYLGLPTAEFDRAAEYNNNVNIILSAEDKEAKETIVANTLLAIFDEFFKE